MPGAGRKHSPTRTAVTGIVLAGGAGRRMGGRDKGLVRVAGRPLIAHVIDRFAPQVGQLAISANRNWSEYGRWGVPVWADTDGDRRGPLAGIAASLGRIETDFAVYAPCDSPMLPQDLVSRLVAGLVSGAELAVVRSGGRLQPVFMLVPRRLASDVRAFLEAGGTRVGEWIATRRAAIVDFEEQASFTNANTIEELKALETALRVTGY